MTKSKQPQARLERWVFYSAGLLLKKQDDKTKADLKVRYAMARQCAVPTTKESK